MGEANTGTAPLGAPKGVGALVDIVLGYPPSGAMYDQLVQPLVLIRYSTHAPSPSPAAVLSR